MVSKELGKIIILVRTKKAVNLNHHSSRIMLSMMVLSRDSAETKAPATEPCLCFVIMQGMRGAEQLHRSARPPRHITFSFVALSSVVPVGD